MTNKHDKRRVSEPSKPPPASPAKVSSATLFGSAKEVLIVHDGREYRLRRTQNGRLILTA